jgi:hypothetical protein
MTPEHIRTVQSTWVKALPIKDTAALGRHHAGQEYFTSAATQPKGCGMTTVHPRRELAGIIGHTGVVCLVTVLALAAPLGLSIMPTVGAVRPSPPIAAAPPAALHASRFILDASSPGVPRSSNWAVCEGICLFRRCATKSLWASSSPPPGFACANTGSCAMAACFALR